MRIYIVYDEKDKCPTQKELLELKKIVHTLKEPCRLYVVSDSAEVRKQAKLMGVDFVASKINCAVAILH